MSNGWWIATLVTVVVILICWLINLDSRIEALEKRKEEK